MLYRIKNWGKIYENNRTRSLKVLQWVPIPAQLDGDGFTLFMEKEDGPGIYGAWICLVLLASKCDPRGTLLRASGTPHGTQSIARITRMPETLISNMLDFTVNECKWLEQIDMQGDSMPPQEGAGIPHEAAEKKALNGMEGKGREGREGKGLPRDAATRRALFIESIQDYREKYPGKMLTAFLSYWGEPSRDGRYLKFEKQETWDIGTRLERWASKKKDLAGPESGVNQLAQSKRWEPEDNGLPADQGDLDKLSNKFTTQKEKE